MGNRVPLRSLSRKILEPAEVGDVLESLHDDHSVAIVGTAILDSILQQMIVGNYILE